MKYNTQVPPPALFPYPPGNKFRVFDGEAVVAGEYSQQVCIPAAPGGTAQRGLRVVFDFNAAPGTFEFLLMEADSDVDGATEYAQVPSGGDVTAVNAGSATQATVDLLPFQGQFFCVYVKTAPTNSNITVIARVARV